MRKRKETAIIQKVKAEREPGQPGINIEIKQTGMIATAEKTLPVYKKMFKKLEPGPAKEKMRDLIRTFEKILKENQKLQKQIAARENEGKYKSARFVYDIIRGNAKDRARQLEIDFENASANNALFINGIIKNTEAFISGTEFNLRQKKVIDIVCLLLYYRSKNVTNMNSDDFISGDGIREDGYIDLMINDYDIAKVYNGEAPGGYTLKEVRKVLLEVSKQNLQILIPDSNNEYEFYSGPLWVFSGKTKHGKIIQSGISIHPIFKKAIRYKFIEKPVNFLRILDNASGKVRSTRSQSNETDYDLAMHLIYQATINENYQKNEIDLLEQFAGKDMKRRKKSDAKAKFASAVEICQEMGIIESYEYTDNKSAGKKYIFKLNKNWYPVTKQ